MTFPPVYLVSAVRSPIGKFGGALSSVPAVDLGTAVAKAAIAQSGLDPGDFDELIYGHARQAGCGPNPARQVGHNAGLPDEVPAYTVNKACASGTKSVALAAQSIWVDGNDVVLVGGMESMSNTPYFLPRARWGYRLGHAELVDGMYKDGFMCPLCKTLMGGTAENLADKYKISRDEQDQYAVETQRRAEEAAKAGKFTEEITPVTVPGRKGDVVVDTDEHPRPGTTMEQIRKLKPVFRKDGTVHAGNSSGITDGAAAVVVASEQAVKTHGLKPMAKLIGYTISAVDPNYMGIAPVPAMRALYEKTGVKSEDMDIIELNEAFAAQILACERELKLGLERVNVNGGAIALGHPIGATGVRIIVTLLHELRRRNGRYGVATLCVSGGLGMAMLFENVN